MRMMASRFPNGRYLECPDGSHLAMWDDAETYFAGLIAFLQDIESGALIEHSGCRGIGREEWYRISDSNR